MDVIDGQFTTYNLFLGVGSGQVQNCILHFLLTILASQEAFFTNCKEIQIKTFL